MDAENLAVNAFQRAFLALHVARKEITKAPLADEADARRVLLSVGGKASGFRLPADFWFWTRTQGEKALGETLLRDGVKEIALILIGVRPPEKTGLALQRCKIGVVSCRYPLGAERFSVILKNVELDFPIAQHVWVRRAPRLVFREKVLKDRVPVLCGEVRCFERNAQVIRHGLRIGQILQGRAVIRAVVLFPVLHKEANHLKARSLKPQCRDGTVHPAGQANDHARARFRLGRGAKGSGGDGLDHGWGFLTVDAVAIVPARARGPPVRGKQRVTDSDGFTHLDAEGRANMVDVGEKPSTAREARASGRLCMAPETLQKLQAGTHRKGDVLATARIAAIMGAKRTHELIPLCHSLPLSSVKVRFDVEEPATLHVTASVKTTAQTGVEMEALTAVSLAALTVYDMCKAVDRGMVIEGIALEEKRGGASGLWLRESETHA